MMKNKTYLTIDTYGELEHPHYTHVNVIYKK